MTAPDCPFEAPKGDMADSASSHRAMSRKRAEPHSEARPERRRHVVERGAADTANLLRHHLHPQPVSARGTSRIQTLYRPARQILHGPWCLAKSVARHSNRQSLAAKARYSWEDFASQGSSVSSRNSYH
jgi:hypothetical protein